MATKLIDASEVREVADMNGIALSKMYNGVSGEGLVSALLTLNNFTSGAKSGGHGAWARRCLFTMEVVKKGFFCHNLKIAAKVLKGVKAEHISALRKNADARLNASQATSEASIASTKRAHALIKEMDVSDFHAAADAIATIAKSRFSVIGVKFAVEGQKAADVRKDYVVNIVNDVFFTAVTAAKRSKAIKSTGLMGSK